MLRRHQQDRNGNNALQDSSGRRADHHRLPTECRNKSDQTSRLSRRGRRRELGSKENVLQGISSRRRRNRSGAQGRRLRPRNPGKYDLRYRTSIRYWTRHWRPRQAPGLHTGLHRNLQGDADLSVRSGRGVHPLDNSYRHAPGIHAIGPIRSGVRGHVSTDLVNRIHARKLLTGFPLAPSTPTRPDCISQNLLRRNTGSGRVGLNFCDYLFHNVTVWENFPAQSREFFPVHSQLQAWE